MAAVLVPAGCRRRSTEAHELVVVQASTGVTLDPHRHHDMPTLSVLSNCYESLVAFGLDMDLVPQLATGWESISDRETRLQVRRGVSFHDGRPLSAADVVASLKRSLAMPRLGFDPQLKQVEDVRALNDHTVAIVTRQPSPLLLNDLVFVSILPADTPLEPVAKVVGTGPYKMTSGSAGGELSLERFDRYWGTAPEFEHVRLVPVADDDERAARVARGEADLVAFPETHWAERPNATRFRFLKREGLAVTFLGLIARPDGPFADRSVRQAVAGALDRPALAERALAGLAVPIDQLVPRGVLGFSPELGPAIADSKRAAATLARSQLRRPMQLMAPAVHERVAREVAQQLAAVGVTLRPKILPWKEFLDQLPKGESEAELRSVSSTTGDALDVLDMLHTAGPPGPVANHYGYSNPDLDRLLEKAATTLDPAERAELLHQAMAIVREDAVLIPLVARYRLYALRRGLSWSPRLDGRVLAQHVHLAMN